MNYQEQALDFAKSHGITLTVEHEYLGEMWGDGIIRHIYELILSRNGLEYGFTFGQSVANSGEEPTMYDVLACLTKYDPGAFEDFCDEYGYATDSRTAERVYNAVCEEWQAVKRLFGDIIEELQEIS